MILYPAIQQSCLSLEEDTTSILNFENLKDEGAIFAATVPIYRAYLETVRWPNKQYVTDMGADDVTTWWAGGRATLRMHDRLDYGDGKNSENPWIGDYWEYYWKIILNANILIQGLKTSKAPVKVIKRAEAEARFFRALSYFDLVRTFGNMPVVLNAETNSREIQRATVLENYLHIEADLHFAEENLPAPGEVGQIGRVSSAAAKALLANFYLTWAGWPVKDISKYQPAAQKAKEVIEMNYFNLQPINELWLLYNQNSRESVFSVQFSKTEDIRSDYPATFSFHESRGWSDIYPERQFFYDFPEGPRKEATFYVQIPQRIYDSNLGKIVENDPPFKHWTESGRNHPMYKKFTISGDSLVWTRLVGYRAIEIIRYAEVLLIYAEAFARSKSGIVSGDALEALNQVRRRAAGVSYLIPNHDVDLITAVADDVFIERGWELAGERKRWYDLVRLEKLAEIVAKRDPSEEVTLAITADQISWKQYIAAIPYETVLTSKLEQNPAGFRIK